MKESKILLEKAFDCPDGTMLDLHQMPGRISIKKGSSGEARIVISGPEKYQKDLQAECSDGRISIRGPKEYQSGSITISSGSIICGRIRTSRVTTTSHGGTTDMDDELVYEIYVPESLDLTLGSVGDLESEVSFQTVVLKLRGMSKASLPKVDSISGIGKIDGNSTLTIKEYGPAPLSCEIDGMSRFTLSGKLKDTDVAASGNSHLTVTADVGGDLQLNCSGMCRAELRGNVAGDVKLRSDGNSKIALTGDCNGIADLRSGGMSEAKITGSIGQNLKVAADGNSKAKVSGKIGGDVDAAAGGMSKITTAGPVSGNYDADASGMSKIFHTGGVTGKVSKNSSGMSKIAIE